MPITLVQRGGELVDTKRRDDMLLQAITYSALVP